jgi:hypothetical protein
MIKQCSETFVRDDNKTRKQTDDYLSRLFEIRPVQHTDKDGFFALAEKAAKFIFITARIRETEQFTRSNLEKIGVDPDLYEIRFSGNQPKGEFIQHNIDLSPYDSVIFIDDQIRNLENVYNRISHQNLELYKFEHIKEDPYAYYPFPPGFNHEFRFNGVDLERISDEQFEI